MKNKKILKLINNEIKHQQDLAEEYIQDRDNPEDADCCFYCIEILKEFKQNFEAVSLTNERKI